MRIPGASVRVGLMGGLGNQMFQYAAGYALARRHAVPLTLNLSYYSGQDPGATPRGYELGALVPDARLERGDVLGVRRPTWPQRVRRRVAKLVGAPVPVHVRERGFAFDADLWRDAPRTSYLDGYWQSESYFLGVADEIRTEFVGRMALGIEAARVARLIEASPHAVSVHVRRGDYVTNPQAAKVHGLLGLDYYARALALASQRLGSPRYFVFSDDPQWCRANLEVGADGVFVSGNSGVEDLWLMSLCRHHVIANSSFSWWGAWLSAASERLVVAPARWFAQSDADTSTLLPADWVRT